MKGSWVKVADYGLTDLLSAAGATIGVIIAGTIFLQFLSTKYTTLSDRYQRLGGEYRRRQEGEPRHGSLQGEIRWYRRRLNLMQWGSILAALALICFLLAVLAGGLSMLQPPLVVHKVVGTVGLFAGLLLMGAAVGFELVELILSRHELRDETADLDDSVRGG